MCLSVCLSSVGACAYIGMNMQKAGITLWHCSSQAVHIGLGDSLPLAQNLLSRLDWLAMEPQGSVHLNLPSLG